MKKVYIAAPFFNSKQTAAVELIKDILNNLEFNVFSPKDESMFKQGDDPKCILRLNCEAIIDSDVVVVVTDDKDVGTIWEAGFAYANNKKIVYIWLGYEPHMKFNIMLAASGNAIAHSFLDLHVIMAHYKDTGKFNNQISEDMLHE